MVRQGIATAIIGSANVGKSTLMNLLSGRERSIVTDIPGTTGMLLRKPSAWGDLTLRLSDTAGLRQSDDPIEQIGVERSRRALEQCDLILAVFDESRPSPPKNANGSLQLSGRAAVVIYNKQDLPRSHSGGKSRHSRRGARFGFHQCRRRYRPRGAHRSHPAGGRPFSLRSHCGHYRQCPAVECITAARRSLGRASKPSPPARPSMPFRFAWSRPPMPCLPSPAAVPVRKPSTRYSEQFCVGK